MKEKLKKILSKRDVTVVTYDECLKFKNDTSKNNSVKIQIGGSSSQVMIGKRDVVAIQRIEECRKLYPTINYVDNSVLKESGAFSIFNSFGLLFGKREQ